MHALVFVLLILIGLSMVVWGLTAFVRHAADDSPFAAPESPPAEIYPDSDSEKSSSRMTSRN
jgi:Na+-transporting methylmalonyl-CoA/oxaloacetate decarboxylase gamma subunit